MGGLGLLAAGNQGAVALSIAAVLLGFLRFLKWLIEFGSIGLGKRIRHVEEELDAYREVAMMMIGVVAKIDPDNPVLVHAAQLLRRRAPKASVELDDLVARLNAIPATNEGGTHA